MKSCRDVTSDSLLKLSNNFRSHVSMQLSHIETDTAVKRHCVQIQQDIQCIQVYLCNKNSLSLCLRVSVTLFLCVSVSLCLSVSVSLCLCTHWWRISSNSIHKLDEMSQYMQSLSLRVEFWWKPIVSISRMPCLFFESRVLLETNGEYLEDVFVFVRKPW